VKLGQCTFCGFCEWFGCANYSKASPQTTILPVLLRKSNFEVRTGCEVMRVNLDRAGKWATGWRLRSAALRSAASLYSGASGSALIECPQALLLPCINRLDAIRVPRDP
jgi:choline dehydrogenase-like flavoprotein